MMPSMIKIKIRKKIDLCALRESTVCWSEALKNKNSRDSSSPKKTLREHQVKALGKVVKAFLEEGVDRGTLVMACGTGKTLTALRIAEKVAGKEGMVLVLTPSLALVNQMIRSWHQDATCELKSFAVCSDSSVGKSRSSDILELSKSALVIPATTDPRKLSAKLCRTDDASALRVIFATYHSISVITEAQQKHDLPEFDLVIADEAHRTTGCTLSGEDPSHFVTVHDAQCLRVRHRLYMTATPRIYGDSAKKSAQDKEATLASMDDESTYGKVLFCYTFASAIRDGLLSDYKIIILHLPQSVGLSITESYKEQGNLNLDDTTKIIGCWKALNKMGFGEEMQDSTPLKKILAFTNTIQSSKNLTKYFAKVITEYREAEHVEGAAYDAPFVEMRHVDGQDSAFVRHEALRWLGADDGDECRIISNVRCLSEGVDVPALDGLIFFHARQSQQEVVQAVGRVMRKAPGKDHGYIILPVVTPDREEARKTLDRNEPFRVIWQVVNALRSHDDRLDAEIHAASIEDSPQSMSRILKIIAPQIHRVEELACEQSPAALKMHIGKDLQELKPDAYHQELDDESLAPYATHIIRHLKSVIVKHCSSSSYWLDWAGDVGKIAQNTISRINALLAKDEHARNILQEFLSELRDDLNPAVTQKEAIEMLAQHSVTKPIFEALFADQGFAQKNPISGAMDQILKILQQNNLHSELRDLERFYDSVKERAQSLDTLKGKQKLIKELYDQFFRKAFPHITEKLGIAYTPVEVVDFILKSVDAILKKEFQSSLSHEGVHILDPFVGTGTFIARLLQLGLIQPQDLQRKYHKELHVNETVLLAYYVAAVNIETTFHEVSKDASYESFPGICLSDTFAMDRKDQLRKIFPENSERRVRQQNTDIRVIVSNPPYSAGQKNANDNAKNVKYEGLDQRIRRTYAERGTATNKNGLYDSYIRAIRWASDRIASDSENRPGIIGFITNASWLRALTTDGMRKCLAEEFSSIHIIDLKGGSRTSGEKQKKEGGNVFGQFTRTAVAITLFVKNPLQKKAQAQIFYHNIGDYLRCKEKLSQIQGAGDLYQLPFESITPDSHGDWLEQREPSFDGFIKIGDKKSDSKSLYGRHYSMGIKTQRDAWVLHHSKQKLVQNVQRMLDVYHSEQKHWHEADKDSSQSIDNAVTHDGTKIKWSRGLKSFFRKNKYIIFDTKNIVLCHYRPFEKKWLYQCRRLNEMVYQIPQIFSRSGEGNLVIAVTGKGCNKGFSAWMMDCTPNLHSISEGQCFPLYWYPKDGSSQSTCSLRGCPSSNPKPLSSPLYLPRRCVLLHLWPLPPSCLQRAL